MTFLIHLVVRAVAPYCMNTVVTKQFFFSLNAKISCFYISLQYQSLVIVFLTNPFTVTYSKKYCPKLSIAMNLQEYNDCFCTAERLEKLQMQQLRVFKVRSKRKCSLCSPAKCAVPMTWRSLYSYIEHKILIIFMFGLNVFAFENSLQSDNSFMLRHFLLLQSVFTLVLFGGIMQFENSENFFHKRLYFDCITKK